MALAIPGQKGHLLLILHSHPVPDGLSVFFASLELAYFLGLLFWSFKDQVVGCC